ncbi:hypothetical protein ACIHDR_11900 [Nocardia sp. NPDC052278]|uniref:hypothetical protein n=1 Tax=unclassified Nocardia TaxID=2637762 RepID=UPI0036A092C5
MSGQSIQDKARELAALARGIRISEKDQDQARRVAKATELLISELDRLEEVVDAMVELRNHGVTVSLEGHGNGLDTFEKRSAFATGLPTPEAVRGSQSTVINVTKRLASTFQVRWGDWAQERQQSLTRDFDRKPVLNPTERASVTKQFDEVKKLAKVKAPSKGDIVRFAHLSAALSTRFAALPELGVQVRVLLEELRQGITLDDLSNDQIALLRENGLGGIIEVRRKDQ